MRPIEPGQALTHEKRIPDRRFAPIGEKATCAVREDVARVEIVVDQSIRYTERFQAKATVTSGEERERLFNAQAAIMPVFNDYRKKTTRQIPVIALERV